MKECTKSLILMLTTHISYGYSQKNLLNYVKLVLACVAAKAAVVWCERQAVHYQFT